MLPSLHEGDFILIKKTNPKTRSRIGDMVILKLTGHPIMVKRISAYNDDGSYCLKGDGIASIPQVDLGQIKQSDIIAKVIWTFSEKQR